MTETQATKMQNENPDLFVFTSLADDTLHYALDESRNRIAVFGEVGKTLLTLEQCRAMMVDLPEIIAEMEGRNA